MFYQLNTELFRISGVLALILFMLETAKEGFVSFFFNPVWILLAFLASGAIWLFTPLEAKCPAVFREDESR